MTNGLSRPRKQFLDVLRVLATCAVVQMHVLTGAIDVTDASILPEYRGFLLSVMDLVTWCVPVFLLISGYLFLNPERELTYPVMVKKYCRRIALAILLFGVPYAASELVVAERTIRPGMIPEALKMALTGNTWSHMWYLYLILFLYLITPLLKKVLRVVPVWSVVAVVLVIFFGSSVAPFLNKVLDINSIPVLPDRDVYFLYYLCGYLFAERERCVDRERNECAGGLVRKAGSSGSAGNAGDSGNERNAGSNTKWEGRKRIGNVWLLAAAALALGMVLGRVLAGFSIQMAYNYPFTVLLSVLLFAAGWSGGWGAGTPTSSPAVGTPTSSPSAGTLGAGTPAAGISTAGEEQERLKYRIPWPEAGTLSFAVYLVHPVYVNLLYKFMNFTPFTLLEQIGVPSAAAGHVLLFFLLVAFCLLVLALAAATAWVLRKIPALRKYVL